LIIVEVIVFKDYFEDGVVLQCSIHDLGNLIFYIFPISANYFADVDHHVNFRGPIPAGLNCFNHLDISGVASMRKSNHRANANA